MSATSDDSNAKLSADTKKTKENADVYQEAQQVKTNAAKDAATTV